MTSNASNRLTIAAAAIAVLGFGLAPAWAQAPAGGLSQARIDDLSSKHDGYWGMLAPENLKKPRPKAPFDVTGTRPGCDRAALFRASARHLQLGEWI